ncbi:MAG: HAD family phosphatase, partial [Prevotella sp.]
MSFKKVALFDLDGVVFDTEPLYTAFWSTVFARHYPNEPQ